MELIVIGLALAGLNLLAMRYGTDSRERGDWQATPDFDVTRRT